MEKQAPNAPKQNPPKTLLKETPKIISTNPIKKIKPNKL